MSIVNDLLDLDSLVYFVVAGDNSLMGSFRCTTLAVRSICASVFSGIDLPSLKSIHVGDGCFYETPRVEMISEDA